MYFGIKHIYSAMLSGAEHCFSQCMLQASAQTQVVVNAGNSWTKAAFAFFHTTGESWKVSARHCLECVARLLQDLKQRH